ncbi:hypothetical protein [Paraburkholderia sp. CNPSo 3281]|uniref:hypothetical protein n=1 Tax=Paraburkholderia sp. CNPSo 3281 TaxID=2940933 RepID=UPI0020B6DAD6|nr:hypothetical protein [Paraburkholderia sp. CNPSo 3281]MCP3721330.1 hypothetical protein [Paraburkholderia sp. CNPSo 3281]
MPRLHRQASEATADQAGTDKTDFHHRVQSLELHPSVRSSREAGLSPRAAVNHLGDRRTSLRHRHDSGFFRLDVVTDDELHHGFHLFVRAHDGAAYVDLLDKDGQQIGFRGTRS